MNMMYINNTFNFKKVLFYFLRIKSVGHLFEKNFCYLYKNLVSYKMTADNEAFSNFRQKR
jgi:hypothetical protein